jgi:hypothetical protein
MKQRHFIFSAILVLISLMQLTSTTAKKSLQEANLIKFDTHRYPVQNANQSLTDDSPYFTKPYYFVDINFEKQNYTLLLNDKDFRSSKIDASKINNSTKISIEAKSLDKGLLKVAFPELSKKTIDASLISYTHIPSNKLSKYEASVIKDVFFVDFFGEFLKCKSDECRIAQHSSLHPHWLMRRVNPSASFIKGDYAYSVLDLLKDGRTHEKTVKLNRLFDEILAFRKGQKVHFTVDPVFSYVNYYTAINKEKGLLAHQASWGHGDTNEADKSFRGALLRLSMAYGVKLSKAEAKAAY